jgi:hypothetical protein
VWVHDKVDPCRISDAFWFITVTHCNGNVVTWCNHTYFAESAKCGHAEFQLPPGCYIVRGFQWIPLKPFPLFHFTEHAIVIVNCDEFACVHLYTPPDRQAPGGAAGAVRYFAKTEKLPQDKVDKFLAASETLLKAMPETAVDRAFDKLLDQLRAALQKNPPKRGGGR